MLKRFADALQFAAGTVVAGLLIGVGEALYRDVEALYAGALYAALWAAIGIVPSGWLVLRPRTTVCSMGLFTAGVACAGSGSLLVLGRFVLLRDVFHESPRHALTSLALAFVIAALFFAVCLAFGRRAPGSLPRAWLAPAAAFAVFTALAWRGDDPTPTAPTPRPLNGSGVILVVADALRADALGVYGAPQHRNAPATPHIDAWASGGLVFRDASAQASWTRPAVASLLTSRHAIAHQTMAKTAVLPQELPTLTKAAQQGGVHTAAVVTNYNLEAGFGFARGFDHFRYLAPARYLGAPDRANRLAAYNAYRVVRERYLPLRREAKHFYRSGDAVNAEAMALLDEIAPNDADRFILWLHYMEPHDPYFAVTGESYARVAHPRPPGDWAPSMHAAYRDGVTRFDTAFGELLAGIRARGLAETTTIVLVSDHGEEFFEHGGYYHGTTLYEEQLRIPLVIAGPGIDAAHRDNVARQIDIAPTILARLGVAIPETFEGHDLLAEGAPPPYTLAEEDHEGNVLRSLRMAGHKIILANQGNPRGLREVELYDLQGDAAESQVVNDGARTRALSATLHNALGEARRGGGQAQTRHLDNDAQAQLRALGYVE